MNSLVVMLQSVTKKQILKCKSYFCKKTENLIAKLNKKVHTESQTINRINLMREKTTLIATLGSSPAILTEAIWAIKDKWNQKIDEVIIVTTSDGEKNIDEQLLNYNNSEIPLIDMLMLDIGVQPRQLNIKKEVVKDSNGIPLSDIRTSEDDSQYATLVHEITKRECNSGNRVYMLIAGGRKTMGAHGLSATQLYGGLEDKVLHVLVSEPFDKIRDFYYPSQKKKRVEYNDFASNSKNTLNASDAIIDLIEIPFIRLKEILPLNSEIDFNQPYSKLVKDIKSYVSGLSTKKIKHLFVDVDNRTLFINGRTDEHRIQLAPREFAFFLTILIYKIYLDEDVEIRFDDFISDPTIRLLHHLSYLMVAKADLTINSGWIEADGFSFSKYRNDLMKKIRGLLKGNQSLKDILESDLFTYNVIPRGQNKTPHSIPIESSSVKFENIPFNSLDRFFEMYETNVQTAVKLLNEYKKSKDDEIKTKLLADYNEAFKECKKIVAMLKENYEV